MKLITASLVFLLCSSCLAFECPPKKEARGCVLFNSVWSDDDAGVSVIFSDSDPCTCQVVLVKYEQEPLVTNLGTGVCR